MSEEQRQTAHWVKNNAANLQLRNYQLEAWNLLWEKRDNSEIQRALMHLATGLGKTSVAAIDVLHYIKEENKNARVLFVSHMTDISDQAAKTFKNANSDFTISFLKKGELKDADLSFATLQGLYRSLDKIPADRFSYIIWDEAHHLEASTFKQVREHFTPKFELALSATPERADGLDITDYFGKPIYSKSLAEGISEGWLSAVDYHIVFDDTVKKAMENKFSFETLREIRNLFSVKVRNETIAKNVLERRHKIGLDKAKTIVFCQNMSMAEEMAQLLGGEAYHSGLGKEKRLDILLRFRDNHLQVICTVDMFNEGIDIPDARLVVFLRSTSSRTIFEQQLGRGLRKAPNKNQVTVLDFVANVERIDFVRELGRHVGTSNSSSRGGYSSGGEDSYFNVSNFSFEDQSVELLARYNILRNKEFLTMEQVVEAYNKFNSVSKVAEIFSVSTTAIYKHLKRAGIDTSGHLGKKVDIDLLIKLYKELGSAVKVSKQVGLNPTTVQDRLKKAGFTLNSPKIAKFTNEQILEAYRLNNNNLRATSVYLNLNRRSITEKLNKMGIDTSRKYVELIDKDEFSRIYAVCKGDIYKIVDYYRDKGLDSWVTIYKFIDKFGYLDNVKRPITSAQAAAAYYKYGTSVKAGEVLGVSNTYVIKLSKKARFISKYKSKID